MKRQAFFDFIMELAAEKSNPVSDTCSDIRDDFPEFHGETVEDIREFCNRCPFGWASSGVRHVIDNPEEYCADVFGAALTAKRELDEEFMSTHFVVVSAC